MGRPKKEKPTHSSGMYVYKATIGHDFDGSPNAKAKANQFIIDKEVLERTGEFTSRKTVTFESWAFQWLESFKKGTVKEHTFLFTYKKNIEKYLIPYFKCSF